MTGYEKYQLQWMIDHGCSLESLMNELSRQEGYLDINQVFKDWQYCSEFPDGIWASEDEWEDNEAQLIYERAKAKLKKEPYRKYGQHKDLVAMCVCEYGDGSDECVFYIEKDWLREFIKEEYEVEDLDYWLQNEYTSEESETALFSGIEAGVVADITK